MVAIGVLSSCETAATISFLSCSISRSRCSGPNEHSHPCVCESTLTPTIAAASRGRRRARYADAHRTREAVEGHGDERGAVDQHGANVLIQHALAAVR